MTWAPLLLADTSPSLRLLVLRDLLKRPEDDAEIQELKQLQETDPFIIRFLDLQNEDGSFRSGEGGGGILGGLRLTAQALMGLGYFGLAPEHPAVESDLTGVKFEPEVLGPEILDVGGVGLHDREIDQGLHRRDAALGDPRRRGVDDHDVDDRSIVEGHLGKRIRFGNVGGVESAVVPLGKLVVVHLLDHLPGAVPVDLVAA